MAEQTECEIAIGHLWHVAYAFDGEAPEVLTTSTISAAKALEEAERSLSFNFFDDPDRPEFQILGVWRADKIEAGFKVA